MPRSRRSFLAATLCSLGAARFAGASQPSASTPALELMGNPYNQETYRRLAASFEQGTPSRAVHVSFSPRESDETVRSLLLRAFTGGKLPDMAFVNGNVIRTLAERRLLTPLDDLLAQQELKDWRTTRIGSSTYGVAFGLSVPVLVFNSLLVRRAGGDPDALPRTWPGIISLARRIRATTPDAIGGFIEHDNSGAFTFLGLMESYGVAPMSGDEQRLGFDTALGLAALQVLEGFGRSGQGQADMSRRQARRAFAGGQIGVLVTMSSVIPYLQQTSADDFAIVVTPLPLEGSRASVPSAGPVAVLFTDDPVKQQDACRLLRFATSAAGQNVLTSSSGYLPVHDVATDGVNTRRLSTYADPERVSSWYTFPGRNSLKISQLIQDEMQQIATLQKTPESAMASLVRGIPVLLRRT